MDGSWTKEDLAREMGLERDRDVPPETPRDFPDLSKMPRQSGECPKQSPFHTQIPNTTQILTKHPSVNTEQTPRT